ncbi:hypothetical protein DFQ30_001546 [Apophysomyces sp. BC1015]|nr:hypothetical protein DFQ30_001546 [Apophysomyces sp. BC1015]
MHDRQLNENAAIKSVKLTNFFKIVFFRCINTDPEIDPNIDYFDLYHLVDNNDAKRHREMQELIDSWNAVAEDVENDVSYKDKDIKGEDDLETVEPRGLLDKRLEKKHCSIQYLSQDQVFKVMYEYFIKYFGFQLTPTYFDYVIEYNAAKGGSQEHSSMKRHEERRTKREEKEAERLQDPKAVSPSLAGQIACQLCIEDDSISVAQKHCTYDGLRGLRLYLFMGYSSAS